MTKTILNKYEVSLTPKTEYIFPPLQATKYTGTTLDKAIMSKTTLFNSYLKEIANQAEIEKHLTFHVSHHSFGTRAIGIGIRVEVASNLSSIHILRFRFKYQTHIQPNSKGKIYHYIYNVAWMEFSDDEILIVRQR
ncbi:MAG: integrase [Bacteroidia bacterium]